MNGRGCKGILYFHGFASSPHSQKVTRLRDLLEPDGFVFDTPDLNVPTFEALEKRVLMAGNPLPNGECGPWSDLTFGQLVGARDDHARVRRGRPCRRG